MKITTEGPFRYAGSHLRSGLALYVCEDRENDSYMCEGWARDM